MPYYGLVEPIASWTTNTLGRLEYWGGVQLYLPTSINTGEGGITRFFCMGELEEVPM
jgi:hypothetical protein